MRKKIQDTASKALEGTKDGAEPAAEPVKSAAGRVVEKAKDLAGDAGDIAKTAGRVVVGGAKTAGRATVGGATTTIVKTGSGLMTVGTVAGHGARRAGEGIKAVVGTAVTGATTVGGVVVGTTTELGAKTWVAVDHRLKPYWPYVRETFVEIARSEIQSAVQDDAKMKILFKAVYRALPPQIKSLVSEEQFIGFCLKNRSRLVKAALQAPKS